MEFQIPALRSADDIILTLPAPHILVSVLQHCEHWTQINRTFAAEGPAAGFAGDTVQDVQAHYVTEDGLELPVLLPPPPKCWDGGHVAPSGFVLFLIDTFKRTGLGFFISISFHTTKSYSGLAKNTYLSK